MKRRYFSGILIGVAIQVAIPFVCQAASYSIAWTGLNGYSLEGTFSTSAGGGVISEQEVDSLTVTGLHNGAAIGSWDLQQARQSGQDGVFNFNFDMATNTFLTGGRSESTTGQSWRNSQAPYGFGFVSGNLQSLTLNQRLIPGSHFQISSVVSSGPFPDSTLVATLNSGGSDVDTMVNPEPASVILFSTGLAGLIGYRQYRRQTPAADS